jgi:ribosomal protein L37AE/L43A
MPSRSATSVGWRGKRSRRAEKSWGGMTQPRYGAEIRGQIIPHDTLERLWVCGECGSRLVTRYVEGTWVTQCAGHPEHSDQGFIHWKSHNYLMAARAERDARAGDVLAHLPEALRKEITNADFGTNRPAS